MAHSDRWQEIERLYHSALKLAPARRAEFLRQACQHDPGLQGEVENLLARERSTQALDDQSTWLNPVATHVPLGSGDTLGHYRIEGSLGSGGMGEVYRGVDTRLDRKVAIKVSREGFSERFEREARAISALNHPHICTLYDIGKSPSGSGYLVMELVEGETLRDWLKRAPSQEGCLKVAKQVLEALRGAHRAGIIHRDLKPANIMVRADGYVKVLDFGLAKRMASGALQNEETASTGLSVPGQIMGTVAYMSPEQILGQSVDERSDLFAFGIVFYEMVTRKHPWPRNSSVDTLHAILHDDPPPVHNAFAAVLGKLLIKNPDSRYRSAEAVLESLGRPAGTGGLESQTSVDVERKPVAPNVRPLVSIAVLPFVFLGEVDEHKALSLGFADALITVLGNLEDITVAPTSAILNYTAGTEPVRVCRDLGVRYTLQGNVQSLGTQWRVSIHLFDSTTQKVSLSEKYDFRMENVFDVQDEIGRRVMGSLQTRFSSKIAKARDRYSSDPEAYSEFMTGMRSSYSDSSDEVKSAAEHLTKAVELDPGFALAHAWLSQVAMQIHFNYEPRRTWLEKAEDHCERALNLDPSLPEAHWARAAILWSPAKNFQHAEAIAELEQVLAARPNFDRAHNRMASICMHIGRFAEARQAHELAMQCNPKNRTYNLEFMLIYSGDFGRAEEEAQARFQEAPGSRSALYFYPQPPLMTGNLKVARERLETALNRFPDEPLIVTLQAMLHARCGEAGAALDCIRRALDSPASFGHTHHTYNQIASAYSVLGETDKAIAWLERSVDTGNPCWPFFRIDPYLQNLRGEPRFERLVANLEREFTALQIHRV